VSRRELQTRHSSAIIFDLTGICGFVAVTAGGLQYLPVTTKAQQNADNADSAENAKMKSAILLGFLRSSEKTNANQNGVRVTPSAPFQKFKRCE